MVATGVDLTSVLVDSVVNTGYEDLPAEVVERTKSSVLDSLGVMLAASTQGPGCKEVVEIITEAGGKAESTVVGFGIKAPCWMAGFANGALMHALDYDDIYYPAALHPSNTTLPTALAIAERKDKVSGKELIAALALANELVCRLGLSLYTPPATEYKKQNWQIRQTLGVFGGAAAAGKILGFNSAQMNSALGIASQQASGTREVSVRTGSILRALYAGPVGLWGPLAALMVQKGITGPATWLEGDKGLYRVYFDGAYNSEAITAGIGKTYEYARTGYKAFPSCGFSQSYIDATLGLVKEANLKPGDIAGVTGFVGDTTKQLFEPLDMRRRPATIMDAKWSLPFVIACAIVRRRVTLSDFTPEGIKDPQILATAQKIAPQYDQAFKEKEGSYPALVSIRTKSGATYERRVDHAYGHFRNPMRKSDIISKFRDCASFAVKPLSRDKVDKVIETVDRLEGVEDVAGLVGMVGCNHQGKISGVGT